MPPKAAAPSGGAPASPMAGKALIGVLGLAVGLVVGYGAGRVSTGTPVNPLQPTPSAAPVAGGGPETANPAAPQAPDESNSLNGKVVSSDGNRLVLDADLSFYDPTGAKKLEVRRTVNITPDTKIVRLEQRSAAEMDAAQEAFLKAAASPDGPPPAPPSLFKEVAIDATDIGAGETVNVEAATDILRTSSFDAVRISVAAKAPQEPTPPTPSAPPAP